MARVVSLIDRATLPLPKFKKVAAYARVSGGRDEILHSLSAQVSYYSDLIQNHSGWEYAGVYSDRAYTGTKSARPDFEKLLSDCKSEKIEMIICKSVTRFARDTVDTLMITRELKDLGVDVFFEQEGIYTLDSKGELLLTIMSSMAQEGARKISEDVTWGWRKRFAEGQVLIPYGNFLGYEKGEDGLPKIVEEEAKIVRLIYKLFLEGKTPYGIGAYLAEHKILSPMGKEKWSKSTIMSILTNEKYKDEAILQKSFTVDYLTKKKKQNQGEVPMCHVKDSHEAIISPDIFEMVQTEIEKRKDLNGRHSGSGVFSSKIVCGVCGEFYGSRTINKNNKKRIAWKCKSKFKKGKNCETLHLYKENIEKIFIYSFNKLLENKDEIAKNCKEIIKTIDDTEVLETEKARLCGESRLLYTKVQNYIDKNATEILDQNEYKENYNRLSSEYEIIKQKIENVDSKLQNKRASISSVETFLNDISKRNEIITDFDEKLFSSMVDKIIVKSYTTASIVFKNGQEIFLNLEEYLK